MKRKFTDLHHHILFGIDDGAANPEMMYAMLKKAAEDNIGRIIATPHVEPGFKRFNREQFDRALQTAREYSRQNKLGIELYEGCEILYNDNVVNYLLDERIPTMAGTDHVLVEFSPDVQYDRLYKALDRLLTNQFIPIVAHVERYRCLESGKRAENIKRDMEDICFQINCSSIVSAGKHNAAYRRFARKLLEEDLVDAIASDAHSTNTRCVHMSEAWKLLKKEFGKDYADELTDGHLLFNIPQD